MRRQTFLWNCTSVDKESIPLEFLLWMFVSLLRIEKPEDFAQTFSIYFGHECSSIRMGLSSLLGSAVHIREKSPILQDNRVFSFNFRGDTQDFSKVKQIKSFCVKGGFKSAKCPKDALVICGFGSLTYTLGYAFCGVQLVMLKSLFNYNTWHKPDITRIKIGIKDFATS
jgi:hypothetical protein